MGLGERAVSEGRRFGMRHALDGASRRLAACPEALPL
jgi:hypothetical protein